MQGSQRNNRAVSRGVGLPPEEVLFGTSAALRTLQRTVRKVAATNIPIVIQGEGGTGKEMLARWIHTQSAYRDGEFVKVNCAAIPGTLLESELFGYQQGAFTGAMSCKAGRVEHANKGTLFLDEIVEMDAGLQGKLLHFLQDGSFCRLGDTAERSVDVRLICASNKDLEREIERGRFRADLFYRINVLQLRVPPLRNRRADIPVLAEYLRKHYEQQFGMQSAPFRSEELDYLQSMNWPGNVRELGNEVARYVLMGGEGLAQKPVLAAGNGAKGAKAAEETSIPLKRMSQEVVREMERSVILEALRANQWNRRKTAQVLKISYRALIYKIRDAGLAPTRSRVADVMREQGRALSSEPSND
jgi:two-component system, NtrC family, response regulator AtoC